MEKHEFDKKDPLRTYFDPERIEKAPDSFTNKTMMRIALEPRAVRIHFLRKNLVPLISVLVIALLVTAAVLLPANPPDSIFESVIKTLNNYKISLPQVDIVKGLGLHLPAWAPFGLIGIVLIGIFDKGLYQVFHKPGR